MNRAITLDAGWLFALAPFALAGITWLWCVLFEAVATLHAWWMRRTVKQSLTVARRVLFTPYKAIGPIHRSTFAPCSNCVEALTTYYIMHNADGLAFAPVCLKCAAALTRRAA